MDSRALIDLVEAKINLPARTADPKVLHRIVELILDFVSRGPIADDLMDEVMQDWPRPITPTKLWRVHVLTKAQAAKLAKGITVPVYR